VQVLVDLGGEVLVEQRLELRVLRLQVADLADEAAAVAQELVVFLRKERGGCVSSG